MQTMLISTESDPFFQKFFSEHPIKNDVIVIIFNKKHFIFESENIISMMKQFAPKEREYAKRQLQIYAAQKRNINSCLEEIASDYVRRHYAN
ncbi:hypothetical protein CON18_14785 [Bacillus cereus]|uniref:hypothetical protein n=1 Tax=Bacillus cereus TaxID=1396 RepID=UPI000BEE767C|nr:hypothetical protein [Bacillus cereus]PDZ39444.1 hypothetical protein CON18_14785 [Bacillus cereus]PGN74811.1 hypothetical protein CN963_28800 [Bacillus cereus]